MHGRMDDGQTQTSKNTRHDVHAKFQRIPRRSGPRHDHDYEKCPGQQNLHRNEIERVGTQEVVRLTALEQDSAVRTALFDLEESGEQASVAAVRTAEEERATQKPPG